MTLVMTRSAEEFVGRATFSGLTGKRIHVDMFDEEHPRRAPRRARARFRSRADRARDRRHLEPLRGGPRRRPHERHRTLRDEPGVGRARHHPNMSARTRRLGL